MTDPSAAPAPATQPRVAAEAPPGDGNEAADLATGGSDGQPGGSDGQSATPPPGPAARVRHALASFTRKAGGALRRRWRVALAVTAGVLLVGGVAAWFVVNHVIRSQLASLVRKNLDGELEGANVIWRPPFGLVVRDARVVRGDGRGGRIELLHVARLECRLAKLPRGRGPVLIENLVVKGASVHLVSTEREKGPPEPPGDVCPPTEAQPEPRLSDKVRIRHLSVEGGSLVYEDLNHPDVPPLAVRNVAADLGPAASPGGAQAFKVSVKDGTTDLQAAGSIRGDDLLLTLDGVALDVRLGRGGAAESPLPASLEELTRRYGVAGGLSLHGKAEVPLRCPQLATFDGSLEVKDASAAQPGSENPVHGIQLKVLGDTALPPADPSAPPGDAAAAAASAPAGVPGLHLRLVAGQASFGEMDLKIDGAEFWEDRSRGTWRLARAAGHLVGSLANAKGDDKPEPRPRNGRKPATEPVEPGAPPGAPALRGRMDFTAAAGGPLQGGTGPDAATRPASERLHYQVVALPRDLAFQPRSFPLPIEHIDTGIITAADGAVTVRGVAGTYGGDRMNLDSLRVVIPDAISRLWQVETPLTEISGTLTCYQPGPVYPRGINGVFRAIRPEGKFTLAGRLTLNHRPPGSDAPKPKDDFALDVISDGTGGFTLTGLGIPVTHVRGRAAVDSVNVVIGTDGRRDSVVEGHTMGGTVSVHMKISPRTDEEPTLFQGEGWLRDVNMTLVCKLLDVEDKRLSKAGGQGFLHALFAVEGAGSRRPSADTFRARGDLEVVHANFWEDPVVGPVARAVRGRPDGKPEEGLGDAAAVFHVADRVVTLERAAVNSPAIGIQATGTIGFDKNLDLAIVATPIGNLQAAIKQSAPPVVGDIAAGVAAVVQGAMKTATGTLLYQYRVTGPADHPKHEVVPAPALSDAGALLFGRMADPKRGDLLEAVRARP